MTQSTSKVIDFPVPSSADVPDDILREGARKMLAQAIQTEVDSFLAEREHLVDESGRRQVVRNRRNRSPAPRDDPGPHRGPGWL